MLGNDSNRVRLTKLQRPVKRMKPENLNIGLARKQLHKLVAKEDTESIMDWVRFYTKHFPPIVNEYSDSICSIMKNTEHIKEILICLYPLRPTRAIAILESDMELKKSMIGVKFKQIKTESKKIIIYSDKLNENFASSQECFWSIIKALTIKYECVLAYDHKKVPSEMYQNLAKRIAINTDTEEDTEQTKSALKKLDANIVIPITSNNKFELLTRDATLLSIHPLDPIEATRQADYRLRSKILYSHKIQGTKTIELEEVYCPVWAPEESINRKYPKEPQKHELKNRKIRFGAFCRIGKIDMETLEAWSFVLNVQKDSELYFSYMQTSKSTEAITKSYFAELGINPKRIIFLPRLQTTNYLEIMAQMDIVFGASPEQGGVTCTDALMCNVPYITYSGNSTSSPAEFILGCINKSKWIATSAQDFSSKVNSQLNAISRGNREETRTQCELLSIQLKGQYIDSIFKSIDKILEERSR